MENKLLQVKHNYKKYRIRKRTPDLKYDSNIPVFINCRDRLEPLKKLVKWLEDEGLTNIYFIDNRSTYPYLLDYYKKTKHRVIYLGNNIGHKAPWESGSIKAYSNNMPFIVTDPDVIPSNDSHGAVEYFINVLNKYKEYSKVGFGLRIDNIPDDYDLKEKVIQWEKKFWENNIEENLYEALLDTTFALYRPNTPYIIENSIRTGGRFIAEHEPWYADSKNPTKEVVYYRKHANKDSGTWGLTAKDTSKMYF
jgi:hypothetical protein